MDSYLEQIIVCWHTIFGDNSVFGEGFHALHEGMEAAVDDVACWFTRRVLSVGDGFLEFEAGDDFCGFPRTISAFVTPVIMIFRDLKYRR